MGMSRLGVLGHIQPMPGRPEHGKDHGIAPVLLQYLKKLVLVDQSLTPVSESRVLVEFEIRRIQWPNVRAKAISAPFFCQFRQALYNRIEPTYMSALPLAKIDPIHPTFRVRP